MGEAPGGVTAAGSDGEISARRGVREASVDAPVAQDRRSAIAAIAVWTVVVGLLVVAMSYRIRVRAAGVDGLGAFGLEDAVDLVPTLVAASIGALIVARGSSRRYGWLLVAVGGVSATTLAASEIALHGWYVDGARGSVVVDVAIWLGDAGTMVGLGLLVLALPSLFPDGRPVGRWRRPFYVTAALWAIWAVCFQIAERPAENFFLDLPDAPDNPVGVLPHAMAEPLAGVWAFLMLVATVVSIGSLRARWRTSIGEQRQQLKLVLFALGVAAAVMLLTVVEAILAESGVLAGEWLTWVGIPLAWVAVLVAMGVALLRYRLYDVDLVINRTLVYSLMSVAVIGVYALVVAGLTALLPEVGETGASLVGAAAVAVAFAPVRSEVQRRIDRLMFGRRSDPVGVIADVGATLASSDAPDAALRAIADTVVAALKVPGASIELAHAGNSDIGDGQRRTISAGELGPNAESFPLRYQGDEVGRMDVARRSPAEALSVPDRRLLENVAHHAAGVAHAVELNRALQGSRDRLVRAREEERRRLRRDLHDGLGPSLASQTFRLDAALSQLESDPEAAAEHLRVLKAQNRELVADIRRLVYELRPPALDELGLYGAVSAYAGQYAEADSMTVSTATSPDPLGDLPAAVEVAGYRIITEAITNAARHAAASRCEVDIARADHSLSIQVTDDGVGLGPTARPGVGLNSMRERTAELGGTLSIGAGPGGGTQVTAVLPTGSGGAVINGRSRRHLGSVDG